MFPSEGVRQVDGERSSSKDVTVTGFVTILAGDRAETRRMIQDRPSSEQRARHRNSIALIYLNTTAIYRRTKQQCDGGAELDIEIIKTTMEEDWLSIRGAEAR